MLKGDRVTYEGKVIGSAGASSFETRADIPLYVASRGDLVLSKAGELADGVMIATQATPDGLRHGLSRVALGAELAGRLADLELFARVDTCISEERGARGGPTDGGAPTGQQLPDRASFTPSGWKCRPNSRRSPRSATAP